MALWLGRLACKALCGANQSVCNARFGEQVPAIRHDLQFNLRPGLFECPGGSGRSATIVASLHDDPGDLVQAVRITQLLVRFQPAVVAEVVILDPRDGQSLLVCCGASGLRLG